MNKKWVVLGEKKWVENEKVQCIDFDDIDKVGFHLNSNLDLEIHDHAGNWFQVAGVLWRGQFDREPLRQHALLSFLKSSSTPCINSANINLAYGDRLSMHAGLKKLGYPVIEADFLFGANSYSYFFEPALPCVIKVGNWHMGYGKMKCTTKENWLDAVDMASISRDYVGVEKFIHYKRDIRVLIIGEYVCCIERIPSQWKANVCPLQVNKVEAPESIKKLSTEISSRLGSNILGIDWVEDTYGNWKILEANLAPGLEWEGFDLRWMANEMLLKT